MKPERLKDDGDCCWHIVCSIGRTVDSNLFHLFSLTRIPDAAVYIYVYSMHGEWYCMYASSDYLLYIDILVWVTMKKCSYFTFSSSLRRLLQKILCCYGSVEAQVALVLPDFSLRVVFSHPLLQSFLKACSTQSLFFFYSPKENSVGQGIY